MSKKKDRPWQIPRIEVDEHVGRWQAAMVQDFQGLLNEASDVENDTYCGGEREREREFFVLETVFCISVDLSNLDDTTQRLSKEQILSRQRKDSKQTPNI
jgi:hypothetical protein